LLNPELTDVDGNRESRGDTVSVFNGADPVIFRAASQAEEIGAVQNWLAQRIAEGLSPHEIAIFVRSPSEIGRAKEAITASEVPFKLLDENVETAHGHVSLCTMHLAKGLEFKAIAVMACDDEIIPSQERIETVGDDADLQDVYETERHLLYVACTRARDHLLVAGVDPVSEFLDDLTAAG
jgi:superfamily I DNA/RNA helicase